MTDEKKLEQMTCQIGSGEEICVLSSYLAMARSKILNRLYPFGDIEDKEIPSRYDQLHIELAIALFAERGAEGQSSHNENGVNRTWRSEVEILSEITPFASLPL